MMVGPRGRVLALISAMTIVTSGLVVGHSSASFAAACGAGTKPTVGNGDSDSPWEISSPENLLWVSWATSSANTGTGPTRAEALADHYRQVASIDLADLTGSDAGCDWVAIGEGNSFSGSYDGGGHTIRGLQAPASDTDNVAMFSYVNEGVISHVHLRDVDFNGQYSIAGIAGQLQGLSGRVTGSSVTGSLSGVADVGGLVGIFVEGASIDNSFSRASVRVSGAEQRAPIGGLVAFMNNRVENDVANSFSTGSVASFDGNT